MAKNSLIEKKISKIGFGTSPLGGITILGNKHVGMGSQNYSQSIKTLKHAYLNGINFYDTADVYGNGKVEKMLGKVFKNNNNVVICSKFGNKIVNNKLKFCFTSNYLLQSLELSLKRLKRDYIDIYLLHSPPNNMNLSFSFEKKVEFLKKNKKILSFGISCNSVTDAFKFIKKYDFIEYIQLNFNVLDKRTKEIFSLANKRNIKIIGRAPYANGMIFNKNINKKFKVNDFRSKYDKPFKEWTAIQVSKLKKKFNTHDLSVLSLKFVIFHKDILVTIPGMRSIYQVNQAIKSLKTSNLNRAEVQRIYKLVPDIYYGWK